MRVVALMCLVLCSFFTSANEYKKEQAILNTYYQVAADYKTLSQCDAGPAQTVKGNQCKTKQESGYFKKYGKDFPEVKEILNFSNKRLRKKARAFYFAKLTEYGLPKNRQHYLLDLTRSWHEAALILLANKDVKLISKIHQDPYLGSNQCYIRRSKVRTREDGCSVPQEQEDVPKAAWDTIKKGLNHYSNVFKEACNTHDVCYARPNKKPLSKGLFGKVRKFDAGSEAIENLEPFLSDAKQSCDTHFRRKMYDECHYKKNKADPLCKTAADSFYMANLFAPEAYESYSNGQKWAYNNCESE